MAETMAPRIGVMALQGDFAAHLATLAEVGCRGVEVRAPRELEGLDGLILPGGESTTHLKLMEERGLAKALTEFEGRGGALFGTCAGAILLALKVVGPEQPSLGLIDMEIQRNAYGGQQDSSVTACRARAFGSEPLELVFIRAPRILSTGSGVEVIVSLDGDPVLVRQNRVLAATFHPELSGNGRVHRYFAESAAEAPVSRS